MSSAIERIVDALRDNNCEIVPQSDGFKATCPAHPDRTPSLTVRTKASGADARVHCFAGCADTDVLDALGLKVADLYDEPRSRQGDGRPQRAPRPLTPEQQEKKERRDEMAAAHADELERELKAATLTAAQEFVGDNGTPESVEAVARLLATAPDPVAAEPEPPAPDDGKGEKKSISAQLVDRALSQYRIGVSDDEEPFGVSTSLPHVAMMLRGGRTGLRAELARNHFGSTGQVPAAQALADACTVLEGMAMMEEPTRLFRRVAEHGGRVYIDVGDPDGHVIEIGGGRWEYTTTAPAVFARTKLTAEFDKPVRGGDLARLWEFAPVAELDRPVLLAVLVMALIQVDVPHPVLALLAEQGSAKSSTTRILVELTDPSPVPLRQAPRDADSWVTAASGSWVVALDNLSGLPAWLSDSLCRASTGDGNVKRALYSDTGLAVVKFRRCVFMNGIDLGAIRGDLGERLALVDLPRIPKSKRRNESELNLAWSDEKPAIHGALLDLAAQVHHVLPGIRLDESPRMADFARVLAAVDHVMGTQGLQRYADRGDRIAEDSLSADDFIARLRAVRYAADAATSTEVLAGVRATFSEGEKPSRDWPKNGRAVTTLLRRHAPALRSIGWTIDDDGGRNKRNSTQWTITPPAADEGGDDDPHPGDVTWTERKRISSSPNSPNSPTAADQHKQAPKVASQGASQTDHGNSPNSPASHGELEASHESSSNSPLFEGKTAGQTRLASQASQARMKYAAAPLTSAPRGGNSASSPGQTDRVAAALARSRAANPACRYCNEPLEFADDKRDGFHSSNTKCLTAWKKDNRS